MSERSNDSKRQESGESKQSQKLPVTRPEQHDPGGREKKSIQYDSEKPKPKNR